MKVVMTGLAGLMLFSSLYRMWQGESDRELVFNLAIMATAIIGVWSEA